MKNLQFHPNTPLHQAAKIAASQGFELVATTDGRFRPRPVAGSAVACRWCGLKHTTPAAVCPSCMAQAIHEARS